jgi:hypothetical protein
MLKGMAQFREDPGVASPSPTRARQVMWRVLAGVAIAVQVMLLMGFSALGLGWTGLWWYLTLVQGAVGVLLAIVALVKKPAAALLVPLISLALMLLFVGLDRLVAARVCSPNVIRAANELGSIPGFTERPEFRPELGKGCAARFNSPRPRAEVIERYRSAGVRNGWTLATPQPQDHAVMHKGKLTLDVWANTRDDRGMYIMSVRRA